jgi:hypothetical protein
MDPDQQRTAGVAQSDPEGAAQHPGNGRGAPLHHIAPQQRIRWTCGDSICKSWP